MARAREGGEAPDLKGKGWIGLELVLSVFTEVRGNEGTTALMLFANVFFILTAYYLIKPAREGWLAVSVIAGLSKIDLFPGDWSIVNSKTPETGSGSKAAQEAWKADQKRGAGHTHCCTLPPGPTRARAGQ